MGYYTLLQADFHLRQDVPAEVVSALKDMMAGDGIATKPDHVLFSAPRTNYMLCSCSAYFDEETDSAIVFDDDENKYHVHIQSNFKNYDENISKFLDWITPYIDARQGAEIGKYRGEEDRHPTPIIHPHIADKTYWR